MWKNTIAAIITTSIFDLYTILMGHETLDIFQVMCIYLLFYSSYTLNDIHKKTCDE